MNKTIQTLALLLAVSATGNALAQQAPDCPRLPAGTGMHWESRVGDDTAFCRALLADGSEAFGLYISSDPGFKARTPNRMEQGSLDGQPVFWYRTEIAAASPGIQAREASVRIGDDRYVHAWFQADSRQQLVQRIGVMSRLRFDGRQVASGQ